jgi:hypothetical protein
MKNPPKIGDLLRYDDHSYCIVTEHHKDTPYWNLEWILAVDPSWYREEQSRFRYYMEHFSFDSWANLSD